MYCPYMCNPYLGGLVMVIHYSCYSASYFQQYSGKPRNGWIVSKLNV